MAEHSKVLGRCDRAIDLCTATGISTPAIVFDEAELLRTVSSVKEIGTAGDCHVLYSPKACSLLPVLKTVADGLHGFACSSCFEVLLVSDVRSVDQSIHLTSPGIRPDQFETLASVCDYISFNSIGQFRKFDERAAFSAKRGLRVNPSLSFISDERYDPCRRYSKLGVPLSQLDAFVKSGEYRRLDLTGIHVHNNCDSVDFRELLLTVERLDPTLSRLVDRLEWINLGGGYLFNDTQDLDGFLDAVRFVRSKYDVDVYVEPGAAIVRESGSLVTTVLDIFDSDGKTIAILDTSVNHAPEVFEYTWSPDVIGAVDTGDFTYVLAGCSCLAGDVFGEYSFDGPLAVGSRVVFTGMGAYTTTKWNTFNGIALPNVYVWTEAGQLQLEKQYLYEDFLYQCGVETYADYRARS